MAVAAATASGGSVAAELAAWNRARHAQPRKPRSDRRLDGHLAAGMVCSVGLTAAAACAAMRAKVAGFKDLPYAGQRRASRSSVQPCPGSTWG